MISGLKPYPAMKDSAVEWLGAVPADWKVLRTAHLLREVDVRSKTGTETHLSMSQRLGLVPSSEMEERRLVSESYVGAKLCQVDDLVLNRLKAHLGVFARASQPGLVSPDYTVLRPVSPQGTTAFLEYVLKSMSCRSELRMRAKGLVEGFWRLYTDDFYQIKLPVPPIHEQAAIVRFLDHADRRIGRYIRAKQKLIKLLEEQKQTIIHSAVTRGLDSRWRLQPSGVDWLGHVPEHWEVVRNKVVCRLGTGHTPSRKIDEYWRNCDIPWFTLGDVHQIRGDKVKYVFDTNERVSELGLANSAAVRLPAGTVILSRTASVGFSAILGCEMATSQDFMAWTPGERVFGEYLLAVLRAMRPEFKRLMYGSTHNTIYMPTLHAFRMPLPPRSEQEAIVRYVDDVLKSCDKTVAGAEREVALLREYRTRLIADIVTGKLDVREAAARLPADAEEVETPDEIDPETDPAEAVGLDAVPAEAEV